VSGREGGVGAREEGCVDTGREEGGCGQGKRGLRVKEEGGVGKGSGVRATEEGWDRVDTESSKKCCTH